MDIDDRDTLIKLLDQALSSKEESVRTLLQSLLVTTALVHSEDETPIVGPLTELLNDVQGMKSDMATLKNRIDRLNSKVLELGSNTPKSVRPKIVKTDRWVADPDRWSEDYPKYDKWKKMQKSTMENEVDKYDDSPTDYIDIIKNIMNRLGN